MLQRVTQSQKKNKSSEWTSDPTPPVTRSRGKVRPRESQRIVKAKLNEVQVPKKEPTAEFPYVGGMGQGQERTEMKPQMP